MENYLKKSLVLSLQKSELPSRLKSQATTIWWFRCFMRFQTQWAKRILDFMLEFVIFLICYWKEYFPVLQLNAQVSILHIAYLWPVSLIHRNTPWMWAENSKVTRNDENQTQKQETKKAFCFCEKQKMDSIFTDLFIKTSKYTFLVGINYTHLQLKNWWHLRCKMTYSNTVFLVYMFG